MSVEVSEVDRWPYWGRSVEVRSGVSGVGFVEARGRGRHLEVTKVIIRLIYCRLVT